MTNDCAIPVTICVLLYGEHLDLARQSIESIRRYCPRDRYRLMVGSNAVGDDTRRYLDELRCRGALDESIDSRENLNKCPMMRRMFGRIETEFIWWFDDDSYLTGPEAFDAWVGMAQRSTEDIVMWGQLACCGSVETFAPDIDDAPRFVRSAEWYRGLPPPDWRPGGKGEFNFHGRGTGDGEWLFAVGGCWLVRTRAVRALDWPDRRIIKMGDDVFLGEAVRQQGWQIKNIGSPAVAINSRARRGDPGEQTRASRGVASAGSVL